jgi:uncharacterized protein (DUF58 family)
MSRAHVVTSAELSSLRDLELVARTTAEGLRHGLHRSPFHGYSAEFSQYRHYRPGDDLKYVDWKAFGRTDRLYTRQFRETTNLAALFVVDGSRSMDFGGKFALARAVAAVLGTLVLDQGDGAGLVVEGDPLVYVPARSGHHHLRVYLAHLSRVAPAGSLSIATGLERAGSLLKRRGLVVAISDFYEDQEALARVRKLMRMGHDVIVIQTLAAGELTLDFEGPVEVVDLETGGSVVLAPAVARESYRQRLASWLQGFHAAVVREGCDYLRLATDEPLDRALRRFLVARREGQS